MNIEENNLLPEGTTLPGTVSFGEVDLDKNITTSDKIETPETLVEDGLVAPPTVSFGKANLLVDKTSNYWGHDVDFADIQKKVKLDQMANAGAYSTIKAIGTAAAMVPHPVAKIIAGLAYVGSEGVSFLKSASLASNEDAFWTDYFNQVDEVVAEKGAFNDFVAGFSVGTSFFSGTSTPAEVKEVTDSGTYIAGDIVGMLTKEMTMMAIGGNASIIYGSAISNALNTAVDDYALDEDAVNAVRNGFAHGAATGLAGYFFINKFSGAMKKIMPKLLQTDLGLSIKAGTEFSAWGLGEELVRTTAVEFTGGDRDYSINPIVYGAMFGLGAVGSKMMRSRKGAALIDDLVSGDAAKKADDAILLKDKLDDKILSINNPKGEFHKGLEPPKTPFKDLNKKTKIIESPLDDAILYKHVQGMGRDINDKKLNERLVKGFVEETAPAVKEATPVVEKVMSKTSKVKSIMEESIVNKRDTANLKDVFVNRRIDIDMNVTEIRKVVYDIIKETKKNGTDFHDSFLNVFKNQGLELSATDFDNIVKMIKSRFAN